MAEKVTSKVVKIFNRWLNLLKAGEGISTENGSFGQLWRVFETERFNALFKQKYWTTESILKEFSELEWSDKGLYSQILFDRILKRKDADDILRYLDLFTGLDVVICHQRIFKRVVQLWRSSHMAGYIKKLTWLDPTIYHQRIFDEVIREGRGWSLLAGLESFTGMDINANLPKLFTSCIKEGALEVILFFFEKFKSLDPTIYHPKLLHAILKRDPRVLLRYFDRLTWLVPNRDHPLIFNTLIKTRYNRGTICGILDRLTRLDPSIHHQKLFDMLMSKWYWYELIGLADNLEKFTWIDPRGHTLLFDRLIEMGYYEVIINNFEKFTGLNVEKYSPKLLALFKKMKWRKSDLEVLVRYRELSFIEWFDEIFNYYIEHKQKSLIPMMKLLLIGKDIWLATQFKAIFDLTDVSWVRGADPTLVKELLLLSFRKLSKVTQLDQSVKTFEKFLETTSTFDDRAIEQIMWYFAPLMEVYFKKVSEKKIKQKYINELWIQKSVDVDEIFQAPEVVEWYKMFKKTVINKSQFREILWNTINGDPYFYRKLEANQAWLNSPNIRGKNMEVWQGRNERTYSIWETSEKIDKKEDIKHFVTVANSILQLLWLRIEEDAWNLVNYFNTELRRKKDELMKNCWLPVEEFGVQFSNLELQIESIINLFKDTKAKEITGITIYKENEPAKVLMMGNVVDGSCLSFYSTVWNYWSTATNALDVNKWDFYIKDQNGNIIGRVLTAIDNQWNLLRFRVYKKWNIDIDLWQYFNEYIKWLAKEIWLWLNGNANNVELLIGEKWYIDPVETIL